MIRCLIALSVLSSIVALALPILMMSLKHAFEDDRSAWYLAKPDGKKPYICMTAGNGTCEPAWESFHRHCYRVISAVSTRSHARDSCESMNSSLASIHSDSENAHVSALCMSATPDSNDQDGLPACFIGLTRAEGGKDKWAWDDSREVKYTNWGRARGLVGPDLDAVTVNGNFVVAGINDLLSLGVNVVVMWVSTGLLIFALRTRSECAFRIALQGDGLCSVMCLFALLVWGIGHSAKDPARTVPVILLCVLQCVLNTLTLLVQIGSSGLKPPWHAMPPVASYPQSVSSAMHVQPQSLPPEDA